MNERPYSLQLRLAVSLACTLGAIGAAHAQGTRAGLEEIIVTARKTAEPLQETPVSVTAFTAETIIERQLVDMNDIARFTPGLVFDKAFGRATERPVIRGQGNVLAGVQFGVEAGAAYFVDGIYYPGDIQSLDINEIERVEVIRGPQSALYGRNTYSGAINFITRSPGEELGATARGSWDSDEQNYSLRLEGPLLETLSGSISARYYDFDGQWKNQLSGEQIGQEETTSFAGVLEWTPTEDLRVRLRGTYSEDRDGTRAFMFQDASFNNCYPGTRSLAYYATSGSANANQYYCGEIKPRKVYLNTTLPVTNTAALAAGAPGARPNTVVGAPQAGAPAGSTATFDLRPGIAFSGVERDLTLISALGEWDIGGSGYTLLVDGAWRTEDRLTGSDSDFTSVNTFTAAVAQGAESGGANTGLDEYDDYSVEIKLSSPTDRDLRWLVGAFYYTQEQNFHDVNFKFPEGRPRQNSIADTYNSSVFALVEWQFAEDWSVTAEGRYMEEEKGLFEWCTSVIAGAVPVCTFATNSVDAPGLQPAFDRHGKWDKFTPRVTLQWTPSGDLNFYAIYAEGVKPGGFNGTGGLISSPQLPEYDQETSDNFELGMKSTWLDGTLFFNVAAYFIDAKDVQLTTPIVRADGSAVTSVASNQGSGEVKGVEVEARWRALDPLTLSLTYALSDSEFTEGCDDFQWTLTSGGGNNALRPGAFKPTSPATGGTNLNGLGDCSIEGSPFPLSAKHTGSFAVDYSTEFWGDYEFFVNADVTYTDKRPVQVHDNPYVPSATLVGARVGIGGNRWTASLYGRNLTNEDSVAVATRWLSQPYVGFSTAPIPGTTPLKGAAALAAAGLTAYPPASGSSAGLNSVAAYALPRGFFAMLRRERQIGLEVSFKF